MAEAQQAFEAEETARAIAQAQTEAAQPTSTPTLSPDDLTGTATFLEQSLGFDTPTPEQPFGPATIDATGVALTATALAGQLFQPTPGVPGEGEGGGDVFLPTPTREFSALPESGLFDDFISGSGGMGAVALMAFGLVGVIFISRRIRAMNR